MEVLYVTLLLFQQSHSLHTREKNTDKQKYRNVECEITRTVTESSVHV